MMQGLYISSSGMQAQSSGLQVVGNNLANISTIGFKQQLLLFQDYQSQDLTAGSAYDVETKQLGLGAAQSFSRTLFTSGAIADADNMTDLAIGGDGFFQVTDDTGESFYTRAGNFFFDADGVLKSPGLMTLSGIEIVDGVPTGELTEIQLDSADEALATSPAKATTTATALMNLYDTSDSYSDPANPYFSMVQSWDGQASPPLNHSNSTSFQYYDQEGVRQSMTVYIDQASVVNGQQVIEYAMAMDPSLDAREGYAGTESAGLLMAGTMTFSSAGELISMTSFSPTGQDLTDPNSWTLSALTDGLPSVNLQMEGQEAQNIQIDFGIQGDSDAWVLNGTAVDQANFTGASMGTDFLNIPSMTNPIYDNDATTALATSTSLKNLSQDGYTVGNLTNLEIDTSGVLRAYYNNGQSHDLYSIPIFRFTSEDGLRREGDNLYSYTVDAGEMEYGTAGTENYGEIYSSALEQSNVDMSKEMVNMIIVQRGFQSNSKSMQTIDAMIQKAIEMKR